MPLAMKKTLPLLTLVTVFAALLLTTGTASAAVVYCNNDKNKAVTLKELGGQAESPENACKDKGGVYKTEEQQKVDRNKEIFNSCQNASDSSGQCVTSYINTAIDVLSAGVGIVVVIMIIVGGIQYSAAGGDAQKVAAAKSKIFNALLALVAYLFLAAVLQWLIPGGWF